MVCDIDRRVCVSRGDAGMGDVVTDGDGGALPQCEDAAGCEGREHGDCEGEWGCTVGRCVWRCAGCEDEDGDGCGTGATCECMDDCDDTDPASHPGAAEVCDGADNDCNGMVDDGVGELRCGVGACETVVPSCVEGVAQTCEPGRPGEEECGNGTDDDCDGEVDESPPCSCVEGETQPCFSGPAALRGVGACVEGVQRCAGGAWGGCMGSGSPSSERCDGRDNDCNAMVDDGLGEARCGVGGCERRVARCAGGREQVCEAGTPAAVEACGNGVDDDCDGMTDEDPPCACTDGERQPCFQGDPALRGVGVCVEGTQACSGGGWGMCMGSGTPGVETCDGRDNDCDGDTDEGLGTLTCGVGGCRRTVASCAGGRPQTCTPGMPGAVELCSNGEDDDCDGMVDENPPCACTDGQEQPCFTGDPGLRGVGVCTQGRQICTGGRWGACTGEGRPSMETCDGRDNDCDGMTDEGFGDVSCGVGGCRRTVASCVGGMARMCVPGVPAAEEFCGNGVDDDCDGMVDENPPCVCMDGAVQDCFNGDPALRGVGVCVVGRQLCTGGRWGACMGEGRPSMEVCDRLDNNCDGMVDEGLGVSMCGVGACRRSVNNCVGGVIQMCVPGMPAPAEVCDNGVDDNCNGAADENPPCECTEGAMQACWGGLPAEQGVGICRDGQQTCSSNRWGACMGEVRPRMEACDGLDNDCDGMIDEELGMSSCGMGACRRSVNNCVGGVIQMCVPGAPAPEVPDNGIDDDCDGMVDEGLPPCELCDGIDNDMNGMIDDRCVEDTFVSPAGSDDDPGTRARPFLTISRGVEAGQCLGVPRTVRVAAAAGAPCTDATYAEDVTMIERVSVIGGFDPATWMRAVGCRTKIRNQTVLGLQFVPGTTRATLLEGFSEIAAATGANSASVTITDGSPTLRDIVAAPAGGINEYVGIDINSTGLPRANPLLEDVRVIPPDVVVSLMGSTGIRSRGSSPEIRCPILRSVHILGGASSHSRGMWVSDSPGMIVDGCVVRGGTAVPMDMGRVMRGESGGMFIDGSTTGTLITRSPEISGGRSSYRSWGIRLGVCGMTGPTISDNTLIASGPGTGDIAMGSNVAIEAVNGCSPTITRNDWIAGEGTAETVRGIACMTDSACVITDNTQITGARRPPGLGDEAATSRATAIHCSANSCVEIRDNASIDGNLSRPPMPITVTAIEIINSSPRVTANARVTAGMCAEGEAGGTGRNILLDGSASVVTNNLFMGGGCPGGASVTQVTRMSLAEPVVHSNTIVGPFSFRMTPGPAVLLQADPGVAVPIGVYRNNIFVASGAAGAFVFSEASVAADPRILENNNFDLVSFGPATMYLNEGVTPINTIAGVNALPGAGANISAGSAFVAPGGDHHLTGPSPCRNAGAAAGAPASDFEGDARPQEGSFDIGFDEFVP